MEYLTILDFNDGHVYTYQMTCNDWQHEETEQFLTSQGFRLKDIYWMYHNNESTHITEQEALRYARH